MGYVDQVRLATSAGFRSQVKLALVKQALLIQGETQGAMTETVLDKRQQLAESILRGPDGNVDRFAWSLATASGSLGALIPIASSTNATPTVITTASAHGLAVNDTVEIANHVGNTNANGVWTVTVVGSSTTFTIAAAANGVGTTTGTAVKLPTDAQVQGVVVTQFNIMAGVRASDAG